LSQRKKMVFDGVLLPQNCIKLEYVVCERDLKTLKMSSCYAYLVMSNCNKFY